VLGKVEKDQLLEAKEAGSYRGAIKTICKILERPPETVPATLKDVDRLVNNVPAIKHQRSRKTLANTRSRLKAALSRYGDSAKLPPRGTPLHPEWAMLWSKLTDLRLRHGLSRLIRIASYGGVTPSELNEDFFKEFLRISTVINQGRDRMRTGRTVAGLWNEATTTVPGWPQQHLTPPRDHTQLRRLSLAELPSSFREDLESYRISGGKRQWGELPFAPRLKATTMRLRCEQLRLAASALALSLGDPEKVKNLATLAEPQNARTILSWYIGRRPDNKPTTFIWGLAKTLRSLARDWAQVSEASFNELGSLIKLLGEAPSGLTAKNAELLRQLDDSSLVTALLDLPDKLRSRLEKRRLSRARRLQQIQVALAIKILLHRPIRLQNLAALQLGTNIQWPTGRSGPVFIVLESHETKTGKRVDYSLPETAKALLNDYVDRYRPIVNEKLGSWLFLRLNGTRVPDSALRDGISKAISRQLGIKLTPHQFRHAAAKIALDAHPGALGLVGDLLGHSNLKTTRQFYAGLRTHEAAREYDRILDRYRSHKNEGS
jgi:integrase